MKYEDDPSSIKYYVKKFILDRKQDLAGKTVVDVPAGNGITSSILRDIDAVAIPLDLFPEYFTAEGLECLHADAEETLPVNTGMADMLICQEGIEHFRDKLKVFREFNRVIKPGGTLLVTTPNYSNLRAKLSYLFSENERFLTFMPPNEKDSIWMNPADDSGRIYFGHVFLTGIMHLRLLATLSGFTIRRIHATRRSTTCMVLFPLMYPVLRLVNYLALKKNLRRAKASGDPEMARIYREVFQLAVSPHILTDKHLMIEFVKVNDADEVSKALKAKDGSFGLT